MRVPLRSSGGHWVSVCRQAAGSTAWSRPGVVAHLYCGKNDICLADDTNHDGTLLHSFGGILDLEYSALRRERDRIVVVVVSEHGGRASSGSLESLLEFATGIRAILDEGLVCRAVRRESGWLGVDGWLLWKMSKQSPGEAPAAVQHPRRRQHQAARAFVARRQPGAGMLHTDRALR